MINIISAKNCSYGTYGLAVALRCYGGFAVKKRGDDITFLRKIIRGGTDDSFGIEVAKLAGVPNEVIERAKEVLGSIDNGEKPQIDVLPQSFEKTEESTRANEILTQIKNLDVTTLTPIEALNELYKLQQKANEE